MQEMYFWINDSPALTCHMFEIQPFATHPTTFTVYYWWRNNETFIVAISHTTWLYLVFSGLSAWLIYAQEHVRFLLPHMATNALFFWEVEKDKGLMWNTIKDECVALFCSLVLRSQNYNLPFWNIWLATKCLRVMHCSSSKRF